MTKQVGLGDLVDGERQAEGVRTSPNLIESASVRRMVVVRRL